MATCSSILARKISWTEEPGGLQSIGSQIVRHDLVTQHACSSCMTSDKLALSIFQKENESNNRIYLVGL